MTLPPNMPLSAPVGDLRRMLRAAETPAVLTGEIAVPLALGIPAIDGALGGGLAHGALHEIAAAREAEIAAATGFALAVATQRYRLTANSGRTPSPLRGEERSCILWIAEDLSIAESGAPYGPGLDAAGLAPRLLVTVAAARGRDVLWAMEEALRSPAVGAVIGEIRGARGIDAVATRRLSLAAAARGAPALILRSAPSEEFSAAATRWIVGTARSGVTAHGIGPPRLMLRLVRNRRGHLGLWILEWNRVEQRNVLAPADSQPVADAALHRPRQAAVG